MPQMATREQPKPNREFFETGREPEYFVTFTKTEPAGNGNVRVFCYSERHPGEFHLLYTAICPAAKLAVMGRRAIAASTEEIDIAQWRDDPTEH